MIRLFLLITTMALCACGDKISEQEFKEEQQKEVQNKLEYQRTQGVVMIGVLPDYSEQQIREIIENANKGE